MLLKKQEGNRDYSGGGGWCHKALGRWAPLHLFYTFIHHLRTLVQPHAPYIHVPRKLVQYL